MRRYTEPLQTTEPVTTDESEPAVIAVWDSCGKRFAKPSAPALPAGRGAPVEHCGGMLHQTPTAVITNPANIIPAVVIPDIKEALVRLNQARELMLCSDIPRISTDGNGGWTVAETDDSCHCKAVAARRQRTPQAMIKTATHTFGRVST